MAAAWKWLQRIGNVLMFAFGLGIIASTIGRWSTLQTLTGHVLAAVIIVGTSWALVSVVMAARRRSS